MSDGLFTAEVVDLFAGPGGWDVAARRLGFDPTGIEFEHTACETRRAAGFPTIEGDVRKYGPADFPALVGLIASPPCQTFSMAGKGAGRAALDQVLGLLRGMAVGVLPDYSTLSDDRTGLVLDPLRWVLEACELGRPLRWVVLEQVPTVLPVWQAYAEVLRGIGYRVETAVLNAEQYGVPQTRKRAVLVARYNDDVSLPIPTHSRYYSHPKKKGTLDPGVLPWVSMAQALGWGADQRPSMTVTGGGTDTGGAEPFGNAARQGLEREQAAGRWMTKEQGAGMVERYGERPDRAPDEPAFTVAGGGSGSGALRWAEAPDWPYDRPSTTVVGSFAPDIIAAPGYRTKVSRQNAPGSVRVTLEEAARLQTFPDGHPWFGTKGQRHQQVGNAVPPLLAEAVLSAVLGLPFEFAPVA